MTDMVVGDGWSEENGVLFSNTSYKPYRYLTSKYNSSYKYRSYDSSFYEGFDPSYCRLWQNGEPTKECESCVSYGYCWG